MAYGATDEFGFRAVLFVVTNALGRDNFWHDPASEVHIPMLSWEEVKELQAVHVHVDA